MSEILHCIYHCAGSGACGPYTTWHKVYKHRPWEEMHLESFRVKQVCDFFFLLDYHHMKQELIAQDYNATYF